MDHVVFCNESRAVRQQYRGASDVVEFIARKLNRFTVVRCRQAQRSGADDVISTDHALTVRVDREAALLARRREDYVTLEQQVVAGVHDHHVPIDEIAADDAVIADASRHIRRGHVDRRSPAKSRDVIVLDRKIGAGTLRSASRRKRLVPDDDLVTDRVKNPAAAHRCPVCVDPYAVRLPTKIGIVDRWVACFVAVETQFLDGTVVGKDTHASVIDV